MKRALVIHPVMAPYAGGELLCLYVCKALQELDFEVILASQTFDSEEAEKIYGMGEIMQACTPVKLPIYNPIRIDLRALQKLLYCRRAWPIFRNTDANVTFCTQSSSLFTPKMSKSYHFVYSVADLFAFPLGASPTRGPTRWSRPTTLIWNKFGAEFWRNNQSQPSWFFALGSRVLSDLHRKGFTNSSLLFPPCRTIFKPRFPKKKQVVQVARIIPDKRIEVFAEIAMKLPEYDFLLIGRDSPSMRSLYPGYSETVLRKIPSNVKYFETPLKARPELLEESKVYLYTGIENGMVLAVVEALAAGCVPFAPIGTGAADFITASGIGHLYSEVNEAAQEIRRVLETDYASRELLDNSRKAELFGPSVFERKIQSLASGHFSYDSETSHT